MESPVVIAHRGASGERPEHTRAAYALAIAQGADFIEPDLVPTRDGVLICRHENELSGTTDVAAHPRFADRWTEKCIDGVKVRGWFSEDFTWEELSLLRCRERIPDLRPGNTRYDGEEGIPTFEEVVRLARAEGERLGREIGVYPETKHPSHFHAIGLPLEPALLRILDEVGWNRRESPVVIQSFEGENLRLLASESPVRLVRLLADTGVPWEAALGGPDPVRYLYGIGPERTLILPRDAEGRSLPATDLIARAHDRGLVVHPWTFRAEDAFLPLELRGAPGDGLEREIGRFLELGVDGLFCDFPGRAVRVRNARAAAGAGDTPFA